MEPTQDERSTQKLLHIEPRNTVFALHHPLQEGRGEGPRLEGHVFIQLCEQNQLWINCLESICQPFKVSSYQDELLLQDVEKVVTLIAADRHDTKVQFLLMLEDACVVFAVANDVLVRLKEELEVLWEPAEDPLMGSYASMLVEAVVKQLLQFNLTLIVCVHHSFQ